MYTVTVNVDIHTEVSIYTTNVIFTLMYTMLLCTVIGFFYKHKST